MKITNTRSFKDFFNTFWIENPTFRMILGICSALAVTNRVANTVAMGLGVTFSLIASSVTISFLRNFIPARVRMAVYMIIISTYVIMVDLYLKAYHPNLSEALGPYVGLIITNCIIMGRAEAFAQLNPVLPSFWDAVGSGLGYTFSLLIISLLREFLGFGSILGLPFPFVFEKWIIMILAPGAFFILGLYIWIMRSLPQPQGAK